MDVLGRFIISRTSASNVLAGSPLSLRLCRKDTLLWRSFTFQGTPASGHYPSGRHRCDFREYDERRRGVQYGPANRAIKRVEGSGRRGPDQRGQGWRVPCQIESVVLDKAYEYQVIPLLFLQGSSLVSMSSKIQSLIRKIWTVCRTLARSALWYPLFLGYLQMAG
jgi:hypothetical protein